MLTDDYVVALPLARRRRSLRGARLKEARSRGAEPAQLAFDGCSAAYISRLEAGQRVPSLAAVRKIAAKLGVYEQVLETGYRA